MLSKNILLILGILVGLALIMYELYLKKSKEKIVFKLKVKIGDMIPLFVLFYFTMLISTLMNGSRMIWFAYLTGDAPLRNKGYSMILMMAILYLFFTAYSFSVSYRIQGKFYSEYFIYKRKLKYSKIMYYEMDMKNGYIEVYYPIIFSWIGHLLIKVNEEEKSRIIQIFTEHRVEFRSS